MDEKVLTTDDPEDAFDDEEKRLAELKVVFSHFDANGSGRISKAQLESVISGINNNVTDSLLQDIVGEVDGDGSGYISFENFVLMMTDRNIEEVSDAGEAEAKGAFEIFAERSGGKYISLDSLKSTLAGFGHDLSLHQCRKIMQEISPDDDSRITYEQLKAFLEK
ncbi:hypothetical protein AAMO2058_000023900 [Amorphochlora amoebiformis]